MPARKPIRERLFGLSIPVTESGCWLWIGCVDRCGYGKMGTRTGETLAHRVSYVEFRGPIPEGCEIDHRCRVRGCVNPDHLEAVPHAVNVARGVRPPENHRNARKTHCKRGHELAGANLFIEVWRGRQARKCRQCRADAQRRRAAERRAA